MWESVVAIVSLLLAVGFGIVEWWQWRNDAKRPQWASQTTMLVNDFQTRLPELAISYRDEPVRNLSVTRVVFWNAGRDTIRHDDLDVDEDYRLALVSPAEVTILDASIVANNNLASAPSIQVDESRRRVRLDFRYIDRHNGFVIRLVHTGSLGSHFSMQGSIQGVSQIREVSPELYRAATRALYQRAGLNPKWAFRREELIAVTTAMMAPGVLLLFAANLGVWYVWIVIGMYAIGAFITVRFTFRQVVNDIPDGLEDFVEQV